MTPTDSVPALRYDPAVAVDHLRAVDADLARVIECAGDFRVRRRPPTAPFFGLLRAIVYQQLSGTAAAAIHRRVLALLPQAPKEAAHALTALPPESLRAAGLSRAKIAAVQDLAARTTDGTVPDKSALDAMSDDDIIMRLTRIRGIGRWSVEMLLMFDLGRPDVLPLSDLGVRKGFSAIKRLAELPTPAQLKAAAEPWAPYRSVASWYLWRAAETAKS